MKRLENLLKTSLSRIRRNRIMEYNDWDAVTYFEDMIGKSKIAKEYGFKFTKVSGMANLEEVVSSMRKEKAFVAIDDTAEFSTTSTGSGFFENKIYTIFFLHRFSVNNMNDFKSKINICKKLCRSVKSKMLIDAEELKNALIYIDEDFNGRDIGEAMLNGLTGMYMTFSFGLPEDLTFNEEEWDE